MKAPNDNLSAVGRDKRDSVFPAFRETPITLCRKRAGSAYAVLRQYDLAAARARGCGKESGGVIADDFNGEFQTKAV